MFRFLYSIYFRSFKSKILDQLYRRIIIRLVNILLPTCFYLTNKLPGNKIRHTIEGRKRKLIVSLTSFPARINKVWLPIESILRQTIKPDAIFLCLYKGEFNGKESLPVSLLRQKKRGLQIIFCTENLIPHMKYFYTMSEFPDADIITIDDDVFYPPDLIEKHERWNLMYPGSIICPVTRKMRIHNSSLRPYSEWDYVRINTKPSMQNLTMGVGSAFYPAGSVNQEVFNSEILKELSLWADDLWLKIMSFKNNTGVVSMAGEYSRFFIPVIHKKTSQLMDSNIGEGRNDKIFSDLLRHYKIAASDLKDN